MNNKKILSFNHLSTPYLPTQKENKFLPIQLNVGYVTEFWILERKNMITWVEVEKMFYRQDPLTYGAKNELPFPAAYAMLW